MVNTPCSSHPENCKTSEVNFVDSVSIGLSNPKLDHLSYITQDLAGVFALIVVIFLARKAKNGLSKNEFLRDLGFLLQVTGINGLLTETTRIIAQRPRPFVYESPAYLGANPWHYNSFVSGHTSFTAAMSTAVAFILIRHRVKIIPFLLVGLASQALVFATGVFRVVSGRHFPSDIIGAFIVGTFAAIIAYVSVRNFSLQQDQTFDLTQTERTHFAPLA